VEKARERGIAGATVVRGIIGLGAYGQIHTSKILHIAKDLPMIVEIADEEEKIEAFLPELDRMLGEGLVTLGKVKVIAYRNDERK